MTKKVVMSVTRTDRILKNSIQFFKYPRGYEKCLLIFGCQRSGTTLITHLFNQLPYSRVFGEYSVLSDQDALRIRLNPPAEVIRRLQSVHAKLVVCKPLVESQRTRAVLDSIPESSALWVYRNFKDVALSSSKKTNTPAGHGNILSIVEDKADDWRNEAVSEQTRELVQRLYSPTMSALDAACLFWYARNSLYFEQNLADEPRICIWKYEDFVDNPTDPMNALLHSLGQSPCDESMKGHVFQSSVGSAEDIDISSEIKHLCAQLQTRLDHSYCQAKNW